MAKIYKINPFNGAYQLGGRLLVEYIDADVIGLVRVIVENHVTKVLPKLHPQKIFTAGSPEKLLPAIWKFGTSFDSKPSGFSGSIRENSNRGCIHLLSAIYRGYN